MAAAVAQALLQGATAPAACLLGTAIAAPLILPNPAAAPADFTAVVLSAEVVAADGTCQLSSGSTVHVSTRFAPAVGAPPASSCVAAVDRLVAQCSEPLAAEYAYRQLAGAGLQYGPSFRLLRSIKRGAGAAAAKVQQPAAQLPAEFILNPAVLDSCLQLGGMVPAEPAAAAGSGGQQSTYVPASLAALYLGDSLSGSSSSGGGPATALAQRPAGTADSAAAVVRNHAIVGAAGSIVCQLERLESKSTSRGAAATASTAAAEAKQDMLYEICWAAADPTDTALRLLAAADGASLLGLPATAGTVQLAAASIAAVQGTLQSTAASLQLQTRGQHAALAAPAASAGIEGAGQLWGLLRTTAAECQSLAVSGADADALAPPAGRASATAGQLVLGSQPAGPFDGYGSAAASGARFLPLMRPSAARSTPAPFQLLPQPRGALQNLAPVQLDGSAALAAGQVLVEVKAVGINFRCVCTGVGTGGGKGVHMHSEPTTSAQALSVDGKHGCTRLC